MLRVIINVYTKHVQNMMNSSKVGAEITENDRAFGRMGVKAECYLIENHK